MTSLRTRVLVLVVALCAAGTSPVMASSWAVVVGISQYADPTIADLHYAASDAHDVALALEEDCGVPREHIWLLTDEEATAEAIGEAFAQLEGNVESGDEVYVYLAGHGTNTPDLDGDEADGDNLDEAFLPYDAVLIDPSTYLIDDTLGCWVGRLEAGAVAVFLDSCYSGGQSRDAGATPGAIAAEGSIGRDVLTSGLGGPMRGVLAACEPQQLAYENPTLQHGVFTNYLLQALASDTTDANGDSVVTLGELSSYVIREVEAWSAGRPEVQTPVLEAPTGVAIPIIPDVDARRLDQQHLVFHLALDDETGMTDAGVVNRGAEAVDGIVGQAMRFDNQPRHNTYVRTVSSYEPREGPFAVSFWFRTEVPAGHLFSTHGRQNTYGPTFAVLIGLDGSLTFRTNDADANHRQDLSTTVFRWDDGQWHHLVVQRLASGRKEIWVDGTLEAAETYAIQDIRNGVNPLTIGGDAYNGWSFGYSFCGDIDDFRIYDRSLDVAQIRALVSMGIPDEVVTFKDPAVEAAIRTALGGPRGPLTTDELLQVRTLEIHPERSIDVTGIEACRDLRYLTIAGAGIIDVSFAQAFPGLIQLNLPGNRIEEIGPLAALHSVELVDLSDNLIRDLSPLSVMTHLYDLDASENRIEDLGPLSGLGSMKLLNLSGNEISNLEPLGGLEKIWYLDLRENRIDDLSPLTALYALRALYVGENELADIAPLVELSGLEELDLSGNRIGDISPICELEWLGDYTKFDAGRVATTLDLSDNLIDDPLPLLDALGLGEGDTVDLRGNPLGGIDANQRQSLVEKLVGRGVTLLID